MRHYATLTFHSDKIYKHTKTAQKGGTCASLHSESLLLFSPCPLVRRVTGILPAGPDTYTVTEHRAPVLSGASEAQRVATTEANDYCAQSGKSFFLLNMAEQAAVPAGGPGYSVTLRCLQPDDAELKKPNFLPTPNFVIEQRNQ